MRNWPKVEEVRRRIPKGFELPLRFNDFLRAEPPFTVEWNDLDCCDLKPTAMNEAVPFLTLPDGALLAFWYYAASPAIVEIGAHGELKVIAQDFDEFLKGVGARCIGVPDFDEREPAFRVPGTTEMPKSEELPELQERFEAWFKEHTLLLEPLDTPESEALRQRLQSIAENMIRDGLSKVYTLSLPWWSMDFHVVRTNMGISITYLDYGNWYPVPEKYNLVPEVLVLLELVQNKTRDRYDLLICSAGIVSIDKDRELVLVPPGNAE